MTLLFGAGFFLPLCTPLSAGCLLLWIWQHPPQMPLPVLRRTLQLWGLGAVLLVVPAVFASSTPLLHVLGACGRYGVPACLWWLLARRLHRFEDRIALIQGLLWGAVALSTFAWGRLLFQAFGRASFVGLRAQGPDMNANILGAFLVLLWPLALWAREQGLFLQSRGKFVGVSSLWWSACLLSGSRNAWLAAGVLWVYSLWRSRRSHADVAILGGGLGTLMIAFAVLERFVHWHSIQSGWLTGRLTVYAVGLQMWSAYPLTGMGILAVERHYPLWHTGWPQVAHLHNAFLQIAVESGLPAALFITVLSAYGIWQMFKGLAFQRVVSVSLFVLWGLSLGDHFLLDFRILILTTLGISLAITVDKS